MTTDDHIVFIVDDDARIREALTELLESHGMRAVTFGSYIPHLSLPFLEHVLLSDTREPHQPH